MWRIVLIVGAPDAFDGWDLIRNRLELTRVDAIRANVSRETLHVDAILSRVGRRRIVLRAPVGVVDEQRTRLS